jgi:hypothetical protein
MHDGENESQDTTELCDVYLNPCGVCCALVRKGPGSRSKVWDPGTWIQCVPHWVNNLILWPSRNGVIRLV